MKYYINEKEVTQDQFHKEHRRFCHSVFDSTGDDELRITTSFYCECEDAQ